MDRLSITEYPICIEKARLVMESFRQTIGEPEILRRAKATAHYLDHKTIFIQEGELIVGNVASVPMGMEAGSMGPTWSAEELAGLRTEGYRLSPEDEAELRSMDDYWRGRSLWERMGRYYDDERMWPFIQSGILLPGWKTKVDGRGHGTAGVGWGLGNGQSLIVVDFETVLRRGLRDIVEDARRRLGEVRYADADAMKQADFYESVIIVGEALIGLAERFAALAEELAAAEPDDQRRAELETIARANRNVPANPPRTFHEAMQAFWYHWIMIGSGTAAGGRFDQYMYPYYAADLEAGVIDREGALELLECLRVKVMELYGIGGGKSQRAKWSGQARWNNWVIGGVTPDGRDATNDLTYLILEAAKETQLPHHTITLRVHDQTPEELLMAAMDVVKTGIGMPALVGDRSYLAYLEGNGVPLETARDYALAGCLDAALPGGSRTNATGMFVVPLVLELALNNGVYRRSGEQLGPQTGDADDFASFDDVLRAFKTQLAHFMGLAAEEHNILLQAQTDLFPDPVHSLMMVDALEVGRDVNDRILPFENGSALNPVGMVSAADSLAAIKRVVFDEGAATMGELKRALDADWEGYDELRRACLAAPKFGNGDAYVDDIVADLYRFWADTTHSFTSAWGGRMIPSGISITAHGPGGELVGATPDGRHAGDNLCDGTLSPAQGMDTRGPTAVLRSALSTDQTAYQSNLLNLKLHPSALKSEDDERKLGALVRTYFDNGGKHLQFNVVDRETLLDAQERPDSHRNLVVRVAGYSAYFVQLSRRVQDDIIARQEHAL
jgi:pyruvate formate-lyase/glycerol dehydratase family glycyl radical enzyme